MSVPPSPSFTGLAPELRNRIYDLVFADKVVNVDYKQHITSASTGEPLRPYVPSPLDIKSVPPSILLACHHTYDEATAMYYAKSTFTFSKYHQGRSFRALYLWMNAIPERYVSAITNVRYDSAKDEELRREIRGMRNADFGRKHAMHKLYCVHYKIEEKRVKMLRPGAIEASAKVPFEGIKWMTSAEDDVSGYTFLKQALLT